MGKEDSISSRCVHEIIIPSDSAWRKVREDILYIENYHFGETAFSEDVFIAAFLNPDALIVVIRDPITDKVVGFTYAEPVNQAYGDEFHPEREKSADTAYIQDTAIHPDYIGHHLVAPMLQTLEAQLIKDGYEFLERDAAVKNNYAANIAKAYQGRIISTHPHTSRWGDQVFFRIKFNRGGYFYC